MFSTGHYCEFPRGEYLETGGCEESGTRRVGSFIEDMLEGVEGVLEGGDDEYRRMEMERRRVWMGLM